METAEESANDEDGINWPSGSGGSRYFSGNNSAPGSSGPASLSLLGDAAGSPGLEYDLWEGQFEFLGANARAYRELQPVHQQVRRPAAVPIFQDVLRELLARNCF